MYQLGVPKVAENPRLLVWMNTSRSPEEGKRRFDGETGGFTKRRMEETTGSWEESIPQREIAFKWAKGEEKEVIGAWRV
jgi:hypothetical protein